jgi:tRNA A-37 threonylcarbamoyl transferase component Bud32
VSLAVCRADFAELWGCEFEQIDVTNRRGRGWSQVGRIDFMSADGTVDSVTAYLKRQQNYRTRNWRHPLTGIATLRREYDMLRRVTSAGVAVARPLYFAESSQQRALLVVEALQGCSALDQLGDLDRAEHRRIIFATAGLVRKLHDLGICHGSLYPKHLFWNSHTGQVCLIDWEKARYSRRRQRIMLRDLDSLNRHAPGWSLRERATFLAAYLGAPTENLPAGGVSGRKTRQVWRQLTAKYRAKTGQA